jgi:hypothetical protein
MLNNLIYYNMSEKEHTNNFRFVLKQGDVLLCEKIYDADNYSPFTRYSINIRDILPKAIVRLQKMMSKRNYNTEFEIGRIDVLDNNSEMQYIDTLKYVQSLIAKYPDNYRTGMRYCPQPTNQQIEEKNIRGVECKIGLYMNDSPIVEREFYVDGFNPISRYSIDLIETVLDISDSIFERVRTNDIKNIWDDYLLINKMGFTLNQIREMTNSSRTHYLSLIN